MAGYDRMGRDGFRSGLPKLTRFKPVKTI